MTGHLASTTRSRTYRILSALLCYPDDKLVADLPLLRAAIGTLPRGPAADSLRAFADHVDEVGSVELAAHYVDTFDLRRRCCLYLTYYTDGDTRRRGMSLARLKVRFREHGLVPPEEELPDFLPVVLEYAAEVPEDGVRLLQQHRPAVELLRLALADAGSPYAHLLEALVATLPGASPKDMAAVAVLAAQGPPAEDVGVAGLPGGLDPYTVDPSLLQAPARTPAAGSFVPLTDLTRR